MLTTLNILGLDQGRIFREAEMRARLGAADPPPTDDRPPEPAPTGRWGRLRRRLAAGRAGAAAAPADPAALTRRSG
jgi:hypothetical protein